MVDGFADRRLDPLGYTRTRVWIFDFGFLDWARAQNNFSGRPCGPERRRSKIQNPKWAGARGRSRTIINLFLRQAPLPIGLRVREVWSGQRDSNLRTLAPKASPFSHLWNARTFGFWICDFRFWIERATVAHHSNLKSKIENPKLSWLRGKESNLYFLVQSQASCRLDDPEMLVGMAGLEPATPGLKYRLLDSLHSSP